MHLLLSTYQMHGNSSPTTELAANGPCISVYHHIQTIFKITRKMTKMIIPYITNHEITDVAIKIDTLKNLEQSSPLLCLMLMKCSVVTI